MSRAGRLIIASHARDRLLVGRAMGTALVRGNGIASRPRELNVELSTRCNLTCSFCPREVSPQGKNDLAPDLLEAALEASGARELRFSGLGEPTVSRSFAAGIEAAASRGVSVSFVSNGTTLAALANKRLDFSLLRHLTVSVDAATAETYLRLRRSAEFDTILDGLCAVADYRRSRPDSPWPFVTINWILMRPNLAELPQLFDVIERRRLVVDAVHCYPLVAHTEDTNEHVVRPSDPELRRTIRNAERRANQLGVELRSPYYAQHADGRDQRLGRPACQVIWESVFVRTNGDVLPCCEYFGPSLGHVREGMEATWNGVEMRAARRRSLQRQEPFPFCGHCHKLRGGSPRTKLERWPGG